jgi:septum site-determining protein MinD
MDFGIRSLDIALGLEDSVSPNCYDVMMGKASLPVAAESVVSHPRLSFLSAPMCEDPQSEDFELPQKRVDAFLKEARRSFDYVFLDMSAGSGTLLTRVLKSGLVTTALVVCTHNEASIRSCEKLASTIYESGIEDIRLVINSFLVWRAEKDRDSGVVDIIARSSVPLAGVIPFEERVEGLVSHGTPVSDDKRSLAGCACGNIARRLLGQSVPLFEGIFPKKNRLKLY